MLRLTGGQFRGRSIRTPSGEQTRPTQAKLRQALFNSLQAHIAEAKVLDLFSGSGALGFEALSREASQVVFVEQSRAAVQLIQKNAAELKVEDRVRVVPRAISPGLSGFSADFSADFLTELLTGGPFDLVFADPPYAGNWEMTLLTTWPWEKLIGVGGFFCLEWGTQKSAVASLPDQVPFLEKVREKNYGDSVLTTYRRAEA